MYDVFVRVLKLPNKVKGVTVTDSDGAYCVFVNSEISANEQKKALEHELKHIKLQHFYNNLPVFINENEVNNNDIEFKVVAENNRLII